MSHVLISFLLGSNSAQKKGFTYEYTKKLLLEINPRSPPMEGRRVEQLPADEDDRDLDTEDELHEVATVLVDGALVRSGFEVPDSNEYVFRLLFLIHWMKLLYRFFTRVDRILRRSLGVSETAPTDTRVKPAPPVDPELPKEEELVEEEVPFPMPTPTQNQVKWEVEEIDEEGNPIADVKVETAHHDEL